MQLPFVHLTCQYIVDEVQRKFTKKLASHAYKLHDFDEILPLFQFVPTPVKSVASETLIRDVKDLPILRAALLADADFILTGDKDFFEAAIERPQIIGVNDFLGL